MKTLALLGGMTPDVTALYYNIINTQVRRKLGARHSARMYIYSVDLEVQLQRIEAGDLEAFGDEFVDAITPLIGANPNTSKASCVDGVLLGAILAHKVAPRLRSVLPPYVRFLDVADVVADSLKAQSISVVGLVGPKLTMTDRSPDFFVGKLTADHGIEVLVPESEQEVGAVHRGMMEEVVKGRDAVTAETRQMFKSAAEQLIRRGAQGIILGSTDLGFVLDQDDFDVPVIDAAKIHATGAADWALAATE